MLDSGERQVAPTPQGIRRDHVARYEWVAGRLTPGACVVDAACGVGYGTQILAQAGCRAVGYDLDAEAIAYARAHYRHPRARYCRADLAAATKIPAAHAAVSFETIEHIQDPRPLLRALRAAPVLYASVPNERVLPFVGQKFHHRHYTSEQFAQLLNECGWQVVEWWGQLGPESEVQRNIEGRTLIAVANRTRPKKPAKKLRDPARILVNSPAAPEFVSEWTTAPDKAKGKHVAIVGLGPSCATFFEVTRRLGGVSAYCDEVWGINAIGDVLRCDRVFHMDDVRIQEARAAAKPDGNIAAMVRWLKRHPGPVYTSVPRPGYPGLVPFPLADVLNGGYDTAGGAPYFNSTAAYAIAFAIHAGVARISLFGLDYTLANAHRAEQGRACCEFWLGIAAARGIEVTVPNSTSLLDACEDDALRLYGYDCVDVTLRDSPAGIDVVFTDKAAIPTAEEIERRYDHGRHPSPLARKGIA